MQQPNISKCSWLTGNLPSSWVKARVLARRGTTGCRRLFLFATSLEGEVKSWKPGALLTFGENSVMSSSCTLSRIRGQVHWTNEPSACRGKLTHSIHAKQIPITILHSQLNNIPKSQTCTCPTQHTQSSTCTITLTHALVVECEPLWVSAIKTLKYSIWRKVREHSWGWMLCQL